VKLASRAACAALTAITAATAALLALPGPAFASATPPAPAPALLGTWTNTNPATRSVVDVVVTPTAGGIAVDGFGACSPSPCEWGNIPGTVFGARVSSAAGNSFEANWNFGFSREVLLATLVTRRGHAPTLVVKEFTTFIPPDGRANFTVTEKFVRSKRPIKPGVSGKPATGYPMGDWVRPVKALLGTWKNTSATGGNITKIVLRRNADGSLSVRAFGNCVPTLCNWGVVHGITFGTSISSVSGRVFLAPYRFSFKKALLSGSVNRAGTVLTVQANSEFTDHSGRSNYVTTETFTRA
jgi:hypothetical protein